MKKQLFYIVCSAILLITLDCISCIDQPCQYVAQVPLKCNLWQAQVQFGVYPIFWSDQRSAALNDCNCSIVDSAKLPNFQNLFHLPFIVGGQLSYSWNCFAVYSELNYIYAPERNKRFNLISDGSSSLEINITHYSALSFYAGLRYYARCLCSNNIGFFLGGKIGFIHRFPVVGRQSTALEISTSECFCNVPCQQDFFKKINQISGGPHFGFDICMNDCFSFIVTAEAVISEGPRGTYFFPLTDSEIVRSKVRWEMAFPVTFGFRYTF